ncbi:MAG: DNA mismatch repair protein MutS [Breznakia sp.]
MSEKTYTPMMMQYLEVKKNLQECIVFYRLGDFYEMFFEDAKIASKELDLVLTGRNGGVKEKVAMCGIPYHAASGYITRLTQKGYKVAIVEQLEEASAGKIVKRDVVKIVTPGTIMDEQSDETTTNYIASIYDFKYGLALIFCEMTCGELRAKNIERSTQSLQKTLLSMNIREVVVASDFDKTFLEAIEELAVITVSKEDNQVVKQAYVGLLVNIDDVHIHTSFAIMSNYLEHTQKRHMSHLSNVELIQEEAFLQMDYATKQNLELINPIRMHSKSETLWRFLDHTKTSMGSRLLKKWILYPLLQQEEIEKRLQAIDFLNTNFILKDELKECLGHVYDLERLSAKIAYGSANPRDLLRLHSTLQYAPRIIELFKGCNTYNELQSIDVCQDVYTMLDGIFVEEPPIQVKDGGIFKQGYNQELDEVVHIKNTGKKFILELETKEKQRTGVNSLKIGYNRVFGYYIEVRSGNIAKIKPEFGYERKQTLANAERYITAELKAKEDMILHAQEKAIRLEGELYHALLEDVKGHLPKLHALAKALACVDVLYSLSAVSAKQGYVRPHFNHTQVVDIVEARHPILDEMMKEKRYVANSLKMGVEDQIMIITGPNMGGKSTYMRQLALLVIMAQMGCYIPAEKASLPIFDRIFTRIGASDDIMSGHSTFMVEMMEANYALRNASDNSLILFDEIGRGTSTYDGMSLAYAMLEYIHEHSKAKTLFSTHYHELTALEDRYRGIKNLSVRVEEEQNEVIFLYKIVAGKADKSYGVNVARLAKLPDEVLNRAAQILDSVEKKDTALYVEKKPFIVKEDPVAKAKMELLKQADVNAMTPIEALNFLNELKK